MKFFKKIIRNKDFLPILIILIFGLLAGRDLLTPGYFNMHDDLQMMRQLEMEKCFLDGQIPCRWIPDMGYGFGFPLFNYYPPLPYLVGQGIRLLGFSFITTVKVLFIISFLASGVTMYLLAKEFFGRLGGVVSSIFYIWAPYHSVDVYVRGAMNEAWSLIWFPLILWTSYRLIKAEQKTWWIIGLALSWTGLFMSHNLMVLIFTPIFAVWCLLFIWREKKWQAISQLAISGILAFGLAAFFTLPAILEQKYVQVNTLVSGYYEYIAHFASLNQLLISRFWGYGPSIWGTNDGMSFQVGHIHWILSLVIGGWWLLASLKKRKLLIHNSLFIILFFIAVGWFAAFMAHSRSTFIWQAISPLAFVQFPWRFLAMVILAFSFIAGSIVLVLRPFGKLRVIIPSFLVIFLVIINWNYFKPQHMGPLTDKEKFSGAAWELQQTAGIYDYLPVGAFEAPKQPRKQLAEIMTGKGSLTNEKSGTNWGSLSADITSDKATIRLGIFEFPNWKIFVDGKPVEVYVPDGERWGRMYFDIASGSHTVYAKLYNTNLRTIGNIISLLSWLGLTGFVIIRRVR